MMSKPIIYIAFILSFALMSCSSSKDKGQEGQKTNVEKSNADNPGNLEVKDPMKVKNPKTADLSMYPLAKDGYMRYIFTLPKQSNEENYKVEIYGGKVMEVDCNDHVLTGNFEKEEVDGWAYPYYNFETSGEVVSSQKACLDNTMEKKFIESKGELFRYNSKLPVVVYAPKGLVINYAIWERQENEANASSNSTLNTSMFPEAIAGYKRQMITLVSQSNESDYKVEIYGGKMMEVDCNNHVLLGDFVVNDLEGWGYNYYNFESDGNARSTRMRCKDQKMTNKFVQSQGELLRYNSKLPVVVYTPIDFNIKFAIWNRNDMRQLEQSEISNTINVVLMGMQPIEIHNKTFDLTLYGYDNLLADHSATVIFKKQYSVNQIPALIRVDIPKEAPSLIQPKLSSPDQARYYLSIDWDNSANQDGTEKITFDANKKSPNISIESKRETLYLKLVE